MDLDDILQDIHVLEQDLQTFERKCGVLSETFYKSYLDEQHWAAQFASTTNEQWAHIAARVREEIATGLAVPLDHSQL